MFVLHTLCPDLDWQVTVAATPQTCTAAQPPHLSHQLEEAAVHLHLEAAAWCQHSHVIKHCHCVIAGGNTSVCVLEQRINKRLQQQQQRHNTEPVRL